MVFWHDQLFSIVYDIIIYFSLSYDREGHSSPFERNNVSQENILRPPRVNNFKMKELHSEVFLKVNLGRLLVFLKFAEDLELTQEEWGQLYAVIYPTLIYQIWEQLYKAMM